MITWQQRLAQWKIPPERIPNLANSLRAIRADPVKHYNPRLLIEYAKKVTLAQPWITAEYWYDPIRWLFEWFLETADPLGKSAVMILMGAFGYTTLTPPWKYLALIPLVFGVYEAGKIVYEWLKPKEGG